MARRTEAVVERREPLSRERVMRAAMELADREGIATLSMRNLARELGVEAMSLYYYFEGKEDLLAGIGDMVMREIELPSGPAADWKSVVRRVAVSHHDALKRHPWIHALGAAPARVGPGQLGYMEWLLRRLREAGFSPRMTHHAYHILDSHVVGSSLWEAGITAAIPKGSGAIPDLAKTVLERVPVAEYPYFHEHAQQHIGKVTKGDKHPFELGLDLILDGLDRLRDERPKRSRARSKAEPRA
jgi:AcrR family transcriptional regulator